jgi:glycosyltransferase involved in cell wall biosynthesis
MARLLRWTLEGRLRRETPDVVHVHGWRLRQWVVPWCALRGIPTVYTEHSNIGDWGGPDLPSAAEFLNCAGDVACVSESACEGLSEWLPGRSLAIHRHIVRLPERAATAANAETRLISVARLRAEKGLDVLIEAAARLRARGLRFRLELLGDGPQRGELAALGRRLGMDGCVVLSGSMGADAVNEKMASADVFVLPSRTEAMPLALLEAMAHGLAIVASRVGGIPEVIREGESGLLAPAGSVEALAEALARVIADAGLRQRLAASARRQAESGPYSEAAATASVLASYSKARSARASR